MGRGIFRPLPYRPPRRIFLPPAPAVPPQPVFPGPKIRINRAILADLIRRQVVRIRAVRPLPLLFAASLAPLQARIRSLVRYREISPRARQIVPGVAPPPPGRQGVVVARLLRERHRRIMLERMSRRPLVTSQPPPAPTPSFVHVRLPATPLRPTVYRMRKPSSVPSVVPPAPTPSFVHVRLPKTPIRPSVYRPRLPSSVPTVVPPAPTPSFVHVRLPATPYRFVPFRFRKSPTTATAVPPAIVVTCTSGVWSAVIEFLPCDDYRLELDGPAADQIKASVNMEFEE